MLPASRQTVYSANAGDVFKSQHWDTASLATSTDKYTLFSTPQSSTKSAGRTSMTDAGQFPTGVQFFIERIGFRLCPIEAAVAVVDADLLAGFYAWACGVTVTLNVTGKQNMGSWHLTNWLNTINLALENNTNDGYQTGSSLSPVYYNIGSYQHGTSIPLQSRVRFDITVENHETTTPSILNTYQLVCIIDGMEQRRK